MPLGGYSMSIRDIRIWRRPYFSKTVRTWNWNKTVSKLFRNCFVSVSAVRQVWERDTGRTENRGFRKWW